MNKESLPQVSVIMPAYNVEKYIRRAIESVLAQTFTDWELIVVNDGSRDNTTEVIAQFSDPRIHFINQTNQGLSAARNTGIRAAKGIYLAFLDADDEWDPEFLECCVGVLSGDDTLASVYTQFYLIDEQGNILPQSGGQVVARTEFRNQVLEGGFFPPHSALVRASIVKEVGLFDVFLTSAEDWDLWLRISERYPMEGIRKPLARYRVYPGSMYTDADRMHANRVAVLGKYFGPPKGDPETWLEEKRRVFGFACRASAIGFIQRRQFDEGWYLLAQAVSLWPSLLERLDTFYELACGDQPRGYRGRADLLDIESNGAEMLKRMDDLFSEAGPVLESLRRTAYSNAYLALAMLSDQAGRWGVARQFFFRAVRANPRLLTSYPLVRRILKLCAGRRLVRIVRREGGDSKQRTGQHSIASSSQE